MPDVTITLTIPDAKVATAKSGFLKIYPNNEVDSNDDPVYTDAEWIKEKLRRLAIKDIRRGLQLTANEAAAVAEDDTLVTA